MLFAIYAKSVYGTVIILHIATHVLVQRYSFFNIGSIVEHHMINLSFRDLHFLMYII